MHLGLLPPCTTPCFTLEALTWRRTIHPMVDVVFLMIHQKGLNCFAENGPLSLGRVSWWTGTPWTVWLVSNSGSQTDMKQSNKSNCSVSYLNCSLLVSWPWLHLFLPLVPGLRSVFLVPIVWANYDAFQEKEHFVILFLHVMMVLNVHKRRLEESGWAWHATEVGAGYFWHAWINKKAYSKILILFSSMLPFFTVSRFSNLYIP